MTDQANLIERLEKQKKPSGFTNPEPGLMELAYIADPLCQEAATALREQQEEIERLREAGKDLCASFRRSVDRINPKVGDIHPIQLQATKGQLASFLAALGKDGE